MEFATGIVAAIAVGLFATVIGFDKERSFYPVVLIVIAALYLLFAVMGGSTHSLGAEFSWNTSEPGRQLHEFYRIQTTP